MKQKSKMQLLMIVSVILLLTVHAFAADQPNSGEVVPVDEAVVSEVVPEETVPIVQSGTVEGGANNESETVTDDSEEEQTPDGSTPTATEANVQETDAQENDQIGSEKSSPSWIWIIVVCAAVLGVILYLLKRNNKK